MPDPSQVNPRREARLRKREAQLDPLNQLDPIERRARAEAIDHAHFLEIGQKSGASRRARAERLAALEEAAIRRFIDEPVAS